MTLDDDRITRMRTALARAAPESDWPDLEARVERREQRRRSSGLVVGLAGLAVTVVIIFATVPRGEEIPISPSQTALPEGALLIRLEAGLRLLPADDSTADLDLQRGDQTLSPYDVDAEGRQLLLSLGRQSASGPFIETDIVAMDLATGRTETLVDNSGLDGVAGPILWAPDSSAFTYQSVSWATDPEERFPGAPIRQELCIFWIEAAESTCIGGPATDSAWMPDARGLYSATPSGIERLQVDGLTRELVVDTTASSTIDALTPLFPTSPTSLQVVDVGASMSGDYVSAVIRGDTEDGVIGYICVVFDMQGRVAAQGRFNLDPQVQSWAPDRDVLAYSLGIVGIPTPGAEQHAVRLLDPAEGSDVEALSLAAVPNMPGISDPFALTLRWSPSGQSLAVAGRDQVTIVDPYTREVATTLRPYGGSDGVLVAWVR